MRKDEDIRADILDELQWDPEVDMADISVTVADGAVTLSGTVSSYTERRAAERAVRRVRGVIAIAQDIRVELANELVADDSELARRIAHVLEWDPAIPHRDVTADVRNGEVTLNGTVDRRVPGSVGPPRPGRRPRRPIRRRPRNAVRRRGASC